MVEDTWLLPLKSPTTFYNKVSLQDMLQHLAASTAGLKAMDIISLLVDMHSWWEEDPRVPEYINRLEDAKKKSARAHHLPITNDWLAAITSMSLFMASSFCKLWLRQISFNTSRTNSRTYLNIWCLGHSDIPITMPILTPSITPSARKVILSLKCSFTNLVANSLQVVFISLSVLSHTLSAFSLISAP
jgi:hypothetical protein